MISQQQINKVCQKIYVTLLKTFCTRKLVVGEKILQDSHEVQTNKQKHIKMTGTEDFNSSIDAEAKSAQKSQIVSQTGSIMQEPQNCEHSARQRDYKTLISS